MIKHKNLSGLDSDVVFIGWQEMLSGRLVALYNIVACNHPSYGSTVTDNTLRYLKLQIPDQSQSTRNKKGNEYPEETKERRK